MKIPVIGYVIITLIILMVLTVILIKKSVNTENTTVNWTALIQGNLTVNITMKFLLPFAVTLSNVKVILGAGGNDYFTATIPTLKLNPGLNIFPITFVQTAPLSALGIAGLVTQKKYLNLSGSMLGLGFERTEYLN